ncbi:uncharacterized protein LOC126904427 [Daktulosphaira vitifoliae]|uniref:uncharacterized protein LOC126904427 n=1 Tax=Daktulosphaira vitifoliae TaxID=58002 RepID=UPI0021A9C89B|nr:uncharacterized protein LOC126904427 [Daktulosphaira vitifoliae]
MDEWTQNKLKDINLEQLIQAFEDKEIDRIAYMSLTENMLKDLVHKIGWRSKIFKDIFQSKSTENQTLEVFEIQTPLTEINSNINCDINKIYTFEYEEENNHEVEIKEN